MLCRFYGFGLDEVMRMTIRVFTTMLAEVAIISKLEMGGEEEPQGTSLSGEAAFALGKRIFRRGRK